MVSERSSRPSICPSISTSCGKSRRTSGSPPVRRTCVTPIEANSRTRRSISSKVRISDLSSHGRPSAGMQYWQRKLQRSVTETRKSPIGRPWPSCRGSACRVDMQRSLARGQSGSRERLETAAFSRIIGGAPRRPMVLEMCSRSVAVKRGWEMRCGLIQSQFPGRGFRRRRALSDRRERILRS